MAQTSGFSYFPPLDQCLAGNPHLLSWKAAYRALCDPTLNEEDGALHKFLTSEEATSILCAIPNAFETAPSAASKNAFETKTAPIQVSQARNGEYVLDEIKQDALWLSKEVKIEELVALRLAVIEWQRRPADQLLTGQSQSLVLQANENGGTEAASLGKSAANFFAASTGGAAEASKESKSFTETFRRDRLLRTYLEEKESVLQIYATLVIGRIFLDHSAKESPDTALLETWQQRLGFDIIDRQYGNEHRRCQDFFLNNLIPALRKLVTEDEKHSPPDVFLSSNARAELFMIFKSRNLVELLRILLACLWSLPRIPRADVVRAWFDLMDNTFFLQDEQDPANPAATPINILISLVTLSVLQINETTALLRDSYLAIQRGDAQYPGFPPQKEADYVLDADCLSRVTTILAKAAMVNATVVAPAVYAWSVITTEIQNLATLRSLQREGLPLQIEDRRRSSIRSGNPPDQLSDWEQRYEALIADPMLGEHRNELPRALAERATDVMRVNEVIALLSSAATSTWESETSTATAYMIQEALLSLLSKGMIWSDYSEDVLNAVFALLAPGSTVQSANPQMLAQRFLADHEYLRRHVFDQARNRYPYELTSFVHLLTLVTPASPSQVVEMLEAQTTITLVVQPEFRAYRLESEEEGLNEMMLTGNLPIFHKRQWASSNPRAAISNGDVQHESQIMSVPPGVSGSIIREEHPRVLRMNHPHSVLEYLGFLLSTMISSNEYVSSQPNDELDPLSAAAIVSLINALMSDVKRSDWAERAKLVLYQCSAGLGHEEDIVSTISKIMEAELLAYLDQSPSEGSLDLLIACAEFLTTLSKIRPERVWAMLSSSCLLGVSGGAPALVAVVAGAEVQLGQYRFLVACTELYGQLLNDAIAGLIKRKQHLPKRPGNRFDSPTEVIESPPERIMTVVLNAYQRIMLEAFQNLASWRFDTPEEKLALGRIMASSFSVVLQATYGIEDPAEIDKNADGSDNEERDRVSSMLMPAGEMVIEAFAPKSGGSPFMDTVHGLLVDALATGDDALSPRLRSILIDETKTLCTFVSRLIATAKYVDQGRAATLSTALLRGSMRTLASLYACDHVYKASVANLLAEMVDGLNADEQEPAAILGPLDVQSQKSFLAVVSQLDQPMQDEEAEVEIWKLLSTILGGRQQWFAVYLLTGHLPRTRLKDTTASQDSSKGKSLLAYALQQLSDLPNLLTSRAKAMLKFVKVAQDAWIWATSQVRASSEFLTGALKWLNELSRRQGQGSDHWMRTNECQMAALLCDILAVNLHASLEAGDKTLLRQIKDNLAFLSVNGVTVNAFNRSLHSNLADNLRARYRGCELSDFTRTAANSAELGEDYFYDLELAERVLNHDSSWKEAANGRNRRQGFIDEFKRANINLSLVEAQTALLKSWKTLAATLCENLDQEPGLQSSLAKAAEACLTENLNANVDEPGTADALQSRAEMAFVLISKLVGIQCPDPTMKQLLSSAWSLVRTCPVDFDVATAQEDLSYYRMVLQILYLALQPHIYLKLGPTQTKPTDNTEIHLLSPAVGAALVDIVRRGVAPAFRALCGNLHTDLRMALPADFSLITALLQAVLSVQGVNTVHAQIGEVVAASGIVRGALSLYSWADQLAEATGQDPIYGEAAVMFLLALSSITPAAEQMAIGGALVQLSSANLSSYFRKPGGKGPFDEPGRMFSIWVDGFLPLLLNLLDAVGPPVAGDVAGFLNAFPEQLTRAETALQPHGPRANPHQGSVTLGLVKEAHCLIMIHIIVQSDAARAAAEGISAGDIPKLDVDMQSIRTLVESLPRSQRSLVDRVVATNAREAEWAGRIAPGSPNTILAEKVIQEVNSAIACLGLAEGS